MNTKKPPYENTEVFASVDRIINDLCSWDGLSNADNFTLRKTL